ncbi:MAG: hypothetical protein ACYC6Y_29140 [Thermoguttaceae bacterium]
MPEPIQHAEKRNVVESILRSIPGFRGYLEKEYRRDADALQRQWLADRLRRAKGGLDQFARPLADAGKFDLLPEVDRIRARLDTLIARIQGAMRGYSGFFDLVQVKEDALDRVYQHDLALIVDVDGLAGAVEQLPMALDPAAQLAELHRQLDDVGRKWDGRTDILAGLE